MSREIEIEAVLRRQLFGGGVAEDVEAFGVGLHQAVLDAVVNHFHEMARPGGAAVEVALLRRALLAFSPRSRRDVPAAGSERLPDRIEALDDIAVAADHQAISALEPPDAAARPRVDVVDVLRAQLRGAPHIVLEVGVAAIDQGVTRLQEAAELADESFRRRSCGDHDPGGPGRAQLRDEVLERRRSRGAFLREALHGRRVAVEHHALMAASQQPPHHVAAHAAEADHSDLHLPSFRSRPRGAFRVYIRGGSPVCIPRSA